MHSSDERVRGRQQALFISSSPFHSFTSPFIPLLFTLLSPFPSSLSTPHSLSFLPFSCPVLLSIFRFMHSPAVPSIVMPPAVLHGWPHAASLLSLNMHPPPPPPLTPLLTLFPSLLLSCLHLYGVVGVRPLVAY